MKIESLRKKVQKECKARGHHIVWGEMEVEQSDRKCKQVLQTGWCDNTLCNLEVAIDLFQNNNDSGYIDYNKYNSDGSVSFCNPVDQINFDYNNTLEYYTDKYNTEKEILHTKFTNDVHFLKEDRDAAIKALKRRKK